MSFISFVLMFSLASFANEKESIRKAIHVNLKEVQACHAKAAKTTSGLDGKVVVRWDINSKGKAKDIRIVEKSSTLNDATLNACMVERISTWKFPKSKKLTLTEATYPFVFHKGKVK